MVAVLRAAPDSELEAAPVPPWLVRNDGARCSIVCAASVLSLMGAAREGLVEAISAGSGYIEGYGPPIRAYLGGHSALDRSIERAGRAGGLQVRSRTRFLLRWEAIAGSIAEDRPVVLHCFRAPSRQWSHAVLAIAAAANPLRLLTLDPNDGKRRWLTWGRPTTGWICSATFIQPATADRPGKLR